MKSYLKYPVFLLLVLFMTACPFDAPFPLGDADTAYPEGLIGKWISSSSEGSDNPEYYEISDIDGLSFNIQEFTWDSDAQEYYPTPYTGHITYIDGDAFINLFDGSMETYYFYRLGWSDENHIVLQPVTEYITEDFTSGEEMKAFFARYKNLSFFYGETEEFYRYP